jgi:hypothetical protein
MAAPTESSVIKAQSTKRPTPPHPNNSGGDALRAGIEKLKEHRAEKESKPNRSNGA